MAKPRFADPWFGPYNTPTGGFRDSSGFVNRIPGRIEAYGLSVMGTVDAGKMWAEIGNSDFQPLLVGGKAVVTIFFQRYTDSDFGGPCVEMIYLTQVTRRDEPQVSLPMDSPMSILIDHPRAQSFVQVSLVSDVPENPGAAMTAIVGGRSVWGWPRLPEPGLIDQAYEEKDGKKVSWQSDAAHKGKNVLSIRVALPETDPNHMVVPVDVVTPNDGMVFNGPFRGQHGQALCANQAVALWNPETDSLGMGEDEYFGKPFTRWNLEPMIKGHWTDVKLASLMPVGWMSSAETAAAVEEHEKMLATGLKMGAVNTPWKKL